MIADLKTEFNKLMEPLFYRTVFRKAMDRANTEVQGITSNPPPRSRFAKYLGTLSKSQRANVATSKPFAAGPVNVSKGMVSMQGRMGTGDAHFLYINEVKPVDQIAEEAVVAELLASADEWMHIVVQSAMRNGTTTQLGRSRESGSA